MKKLTQFIAIVLLTVCSLCLFSCDKPAEDVVITVDATKMEIEDKTLKDYMDYLVSEGELSYLVSNGMITEVNGVKNGTNQYWMIYTNDFEYSNTAWGTYEKDGVTYSSATLGIEELPIKDGAIYILTYQTF